jgi:pimeloyl-ACP methyl ester carboxylesterase
MLNDWMQGGDYFSYRKDEHDYTIFYCDPAKSSTLEKHKPTLLLIHGFPTASIDWQHVWPHLAKHFRLITLDMIGFGLSDKPIDYAYSIGDQADIFQALLKRLEVSEYHLLAHDYGDTVAQELLARQIDEKKIDVGKAFSPQILSTLLLNGGLFPETHHPVLVQKLLISPLGSWLIKFYSFKKLKKTFATICAKTIAEEELNVYWDLLQYNQGKAVMPKLIRYMRERREHRTRWVGALQDSQLPIRVIDGIDDPISGGHMLARYRQLISNPDVVELAGIGHYPQIEAPERVIAAALEFWQRHGFIATTES